MFWEKLEKLQLHSLGETTEELEKSERNFAVVTCMMI